ncbi:hypothetical protein D3C72_1146530 [compost metagenome]
MESQNGREAQDGDVAPAVLVVALGIPHAHAQIPMGRDRVAPPVGVPLHGNGGANGHGASIALGQATLQVEGRALAHVGKLRMRCCTGTEKGACTHNRDQGSI